MSQMKILFLDIDGVLNSNTHFKRVGVDREPYPQGHLDPMAISVLNRILRETGCHVVISSTWRRLADYQTITKHFCQKGFEFPERVIGQTPCMDGVERGVEIAAWLAVHDVHSFVIVDDDADMAHLSTNLVKTSFMDGLTDKKADEIIAAFSATLAERAKGGL